MAPLDPEGFAAEISVSHETLERLSLYAELLSRWNRSINLVANSTLADPWRRHFLDSAQLMRYFPALGEDRPRVVTDLGSGAGFPGLVLAMLGAGEVHLVESDQRKAAFLREVARRTGTAAQFHVKRIETMTPVLSDAVTARALAPLDRLLELAEPFLAPSGCMLFLKGKGVDEELTQAKKGWTMKIESFPSRSDPRGTILRIEGLGRK